MYFQISCKYFRVEVHMFGEKSAVSVDCGVSVCFTSSPSHSLTTKCRFENNSTVNFLEDLRQCNILYTKDETNFVSTSIRSGI